MKYYEYDGEDNRSETDIYSSSGRNTEDSFEDISSSSPQFRARQAAAQQRLPDIRSKAQKKRKKHILLKTAIVFVCLLIAAGTAFYAYAYKTVDKIERKPLDENDLGITTSDFSSVRNIALLGIDSRDESGSGRSDAIVILTVDKKHKKLKLTSIARDTYVSIDGHSKDKLTHAYAYGRSQLAVKTLNQNFGLEITDYVTMNFFGLARVIDYIGGVTVDVDEDEMNELNRNIFPEMRSLGVECPDLTAPGEQLLCGGQAVCYARIRHIDSDVERGNRQKEVLMAMFSKVKSMNPLKLPKVAEMVISECETSLSTSDIMSLGIWAVIFSPEFEQLSVPNENIPSAGKTIGGVWYYTYDLDTARNEIYDFIYELNYYSPEAVAEREAESGDE